MRIFDKKPAFHPVGRKAVPPAGVWLSLLLVLLCGYSSASQPVKDPPMFTLARLSTDTFTNPDGQHATELEPDTFAFGSTIVTSFEVARGNGHPGGADIGFATSTDAGVSWHTGFLSGLTTLQGGTGLATGNATVTYDAFHHVWLISTIIVTNFTPGGPSALLTVSRSPDGLNWDPIPIVIDNMTHPDKPWIVCDNTASSPFFGHCYVEWDVVNVGTIHMSTSTDGGLTWGPALNTVNSALGGGGQTLVQPNGTVVVPIVTFTNIFGNSRDMSAFTSTDGGVSWGAPVTISPNIPFHDVVDFRTGDQPTAEIDATGRIYVVWSDCRFRTGCSSNDLVISTSMDGVNWTSPARIPIDPLTTRVDHFTPGLGVDRGTSGSTAHLTVTFYSYPNANCKPTTCVVNLGFTSSQDGGATWSEPVTLAGPMNITWLVNTLSGGRDVGDYMSTSYVNGRAFGVFALANANNGTVLDQAIYTTAQPLQ